MNLSAVFETLARRYHVTEANPPVYKLTLLRWNWSMGFDSLQRSSGPFAKALREHGGDSFQIEAIVMWIWAENRVKLVRTGLDTGKRPRSSYLPPLFP
jgi:hypothetical protein